MALLLSLKRTVNLEPGLTTPQVFHVSQNDVGTKLYVGLEQGGTAYTIPDGTTAKVQGCNALGEPFEAITATVSASEVYFTISDQDVTQFAGKAVCEVVLTNGGNILGTANFIVMVEASPMGSDVPAIYTNPVQAYIEGVVQDYVDDDILPDITTAINGKADASDVGDLTELETTDKTSIVGAVNEVNTKAGSGFDSVAPEFSVSTSYTTGQYVYKNGVLYKFTSDHTAGAWTGTDADAVTVGGEVEGVKTTANDTASKVADITESEYADTVIFEKTSGTETLPEGITTGQGYLRDMTLSNPGNLTGATSTKNKYFSFLASEEMDIYLVCTQGSAREIGVFNNSQYGSANRATAIYASDTPSYPMPTALNPLHVEAGQYVTFSIYNSSIGISGTVWSIHSLVQGDSSLKSTLPLTAKMEKTVDEKIEDLKDTVLQTGYFQIPAENWARHAWDGYNATDSRNFRVRCKLDIEFQNPVILLSDKDFYMCVYKEMGGMIGPLTYYYLPSNTKIHLYIRRVVEDTTENADVQLFSNALKIQTKISDIYLYAPTFTDVSMFERVGIGGDSYASGGGIISGITALTWGKNLERQAGITVDIYAKSGQTVYEWLSDQNRGLPALLSGTECGLYWLQHGINIPDAGIGTPADMSANPHPATFYGSYVEAIEQIKTTFPSARIVLANIIGTGYNLYLAQYNEINEAIAAIAQYCEVPLVDVGEDAFYRSYFYDTYNASNHPTAMQNAGIAMANRRLISKCIRNNPSYFINYGT